MVREVGEGRCEAVQAGAEAGQIVSSQELVKLNITCCCQAVVLFVAIDGPISAPVVHSLAFPYVHL